MIKSVWIYALCFFMEQQGVKIQTKISNDKICLDLRALLFHGAEGRVDPDKILTMTKSVWI